MDRGKLVSTVAHALPVDRTNREALAGGLVDLAVLKLGKLNGVDYNREWVSFNLTADKATYNLGSDILSSYAKFMGISDMWHTDRPSSEIGIWGASEFNPHAQGVTTSGRPTIATVYKQGTKSVLELSPTPDSAYTIKASLKVKIEDMKDIPDEHHDVLFALALEFIAALGDANMAGLLASTGLKDIHDQSFISWDGSVIPMSRSLGDVSDDFIGVDSNSLRG